MTGTINDRRVSRTRHGLQSFEEIGYKIGQEIDVNLTGQMRPSYEGKAHRVTNSAHPGKTLVAIRHSDMYSKHSPPQRRQWLVYEIN